MKRFLPVFLTVLLLLVSITHFTAAQVAATPTQTSGILGTPIPSPTVLSHVATALSGGALSPVPSVRPGNAVATVSQVTQEAGAATAYGPTVIPECRPAKPVAGGTPLATAITTNTATAAATLPATEFATSSATTNATLSADASTPEPLIFDTDYEIMFPAAVRVGVYFHSSQANIKSGQLHLFGNGFDVIENADLAKDFIYLNPTDSLLSHAYLLTPDKSPAFFDTVNYEWHVETKDGKQGTVRGSFVFKDMGRVNHDIKVWCMISAGPVTVYTPDQQLAISWATNQLNMVQDRLRQDVGGGNRLDSVLVVAYEQGDDLCLRDKGGNLIVVSPLVNLQLPCSPTLGQAIYQAQGYTFVTRTNSMFDFLDQLAEAMTADYYAQVWGNSGTKVPLWFQHGMVQLYDILPRVDALSAVQAAITDHQLLPLSVLKSLPTDTTDLKLWNAESYLMTMYLYSHMGRSATVALATSGSIDKFDGTLKNVLNNTEDDLFNAMVNWATTDQAAAVVNLTFYSANTPTPYPTATPRPTSTVTIIPSATHTETPIPTRTAHPSDTPIPAGIFATWTPVPPPSNTRTGVCPGSMAWLLLPGAIAVLGRKKRRKS